MNSVSHITGDTAAESTATRAAQVGGSESNGVPEREGGRKQNNNKKKLILPYNLVRP